MQGLLTPLYRGLLLDGGKEYSSFQKLLTAAMWRREWCLLARKCGRVCARRAANLPGNLNLGNDGTKLLDKVRQKVDAESNLMHQHRTVLPVDLMKDAVVPVHGTETTTTLPWRIFKEPLRIDILHAYVTWQRANMRQIGIATKTRSQVRGSGRKIRPQKGLGKARVGSIRSPIRRGGSKAHGPKVRDFSQDLNKSTRRLALRVALSAKLRENNLIIVRSFDDTEGKTKILATKLQPWPRSILIVYNELDNLFLRAANNIPYLDVLPVKGINVYSMLKRRTLILTTDALDALVQYLRP